MAPSASDATAAAAGVSSAQLNPLLIRVDVRAGHGAGKPTAKVIEEVTDMIAFAAKCMRAKWVIAPAAPVVDAIPTVAETKEAETSEVPLSVTSAL